MSIQIRAGVMEPALNTIVIYASIISDFNYHIMETTYSVMLLSAH